MKKHIFPEHPVAHTELETGGLADVPRRLDIGTCVLMDEWTDDNSGLKNSLHKATLV